MAGGGVRERVGGGCVSGGARLYGPENVHLKGLHLCGLGEAIIHAGKRLSKAAALESATILHPGSLEVSQINALVPQVELQ